MIFFSDSSKATLYPSCSLSSSCLWAAGC